MADFGAKRSYLPAFAVTLYEIAEAPNNRKNQGLADVLCYLLAPHAPSCCDSLDQLRIEHTNP